MLRRRPLCVFTLVQIALILIAHLAGIPRLSDPPGLKKAERYTEIPRTLRVEGIVSGYETREDYRTMTVRKAVLVCESEVLSIGNVQCTWNDTERPGVEAGFTVVLTGVVTKTAEAENPGQFDAASRYALQGVFFRMKEPHLEVIGTKKDHFRQTLINLREKAAFEIRMLFPEDVSGILAAMLIGERSFIDEDTNSLWRTGGVIHMLAISGMHLTILGMGLFRAFWRVTISCVRRARNMRNPQIPACVLSGSAMVLYTVFTGMSISTVRACLMFLLFLGAKACGRSYDPPTALAVAVSLILLESPCYLFSSGFLLSVSAVLFTFAFHGRSKLMSALLLYLWMLPLIAYFYFEIPTLSILVNLAAVPFLPAVLGSGLVGWAAGSVLPVSARVVSSAPATALIRGLNLLLKHVSAIPHSSVIIGRPEWWKIVLFYAALFLWTRRMTTLKIFRRRFFLLPCAPLIVLLLMIRIPGALKMTVLSVGQGDSIALELPSGLSVLVDGGSSSVPDVGTYRILPFLKCEGIRKLDYIFVTHLDEDHYNGISELLELVRDRKTTLEVGAVVLPAISSMDDDYREMVHLAREAGARVLTAKDGDFFRMGDVRLEVLNPVPENETVPVDTNAQCLVLGLHFRKFDALLTGDVCGDGERHLMQKIALEKETDAVHYEVLKVAHHGSRYSTPEEFLDLLEPDFSVISVGADNRYGHPHRLLLNRLKASGTTIRRTDISGAVTVKTRGTGYSVSGFRGEDP